MGYKDWKTLWKKRMILNSTQVRRYHQCDIVALQLSCRARRHPEVKETVEKERTFAVRLRNVSPESSNRTHKKRGLRLIHSCLRLR